MVSNDPLGAVSRHDTNSVVLLHSHLAKSRGKVADAGVDLFICLPTVLAHFTVLAVMTCAQVLLVRVVVCRLQKVVRKSLDIRFVNRTEERRGAVDLSVSRLFRGKTVLNTNHRIVSNSSLGQHKSIIKREATNGGRCF